MSTSLSQPALTNLPAELTSFVGRRRELSTAVRLLRRERLVTLTGVAGVGKSRLALRAAAQVREMFPDGTWLVELAALTDDRLLAQTVANVFGIQEQPGRHAVDTLSDYFEDKQALLVLDTCEHLVDAGAKLTGKLLAAAPGLRILATSRQVLGSPGEHILEVPQLPVPELDPLNTPSTPGAWSRHGHDAMRLFAERAAAALPGFTLNAHNRESVARICRRLEGIPLAIELTALLVGAVPVERIPDRLDDYLEFMAEGDHGVVPPGRSLRAAIDWSFDLCSDQEQRVWARVSVFSGSFDLAAAEEVCSGDGITRVDMLDVVAALVDKSILTRLHRGSPARYRMLEAIRWRGRDKLRADGGEVAVRRRHRDWYLRLAEAGETKWFGSDQVEWFTRLRRDHANLRAALDFCLTAPDEAWAGLRMATALWFYWTACGLMGEGRHWLDRALALNPGPTRTRAKALWIDGRITLFQGDVPASVVLLDECRALARQLDDGHALAYATQILGVSKLLSGDVDSAVLLLTDAVARHKTNDELNSLVVLAGIQLALACALRGDLDRAVSLCEKSSRVSTDHRERWALSYALYVLALVEWKRDKRGVATAYARESLRLNRTFNDIPGMVLAVELLAWAAAAEGAGDRAAVLLGVTDRIWRTLGLPLFGSKYLIMPRRNCETQAVHTLGIRAFHAAFGQGGRLTFDQAIACALGE
jgi:predicted ATPase